MHSFTIVSLIAFVLNLLLGVYTFYKNPSNSINRRFSIFTFVIALWTLCIFYMQLSINNTELATKALRVGFWVALFLPYSFFNFLQVFPDRNFRAKTKYFGIACLIINFIFIIPISSPYIVKKVTFENMQIHAYYGALFLVYWIYFFGSMSYLSITLLKKLKFHRGIKRLQIQYVLFGTFIGISFGTITNCVLPVLGIWQLEQFVPTSSIIFVGSITYAIVRYQLMDIKVVVKKTTVYTLLTFSITLAYILIVVAFNYGFGKFTDYKTVLPALAASIIIAFAFVPLKSVLQRVVDKIFIEIYDHHAVIQDVGKTLSSVKTMEELLEQTLLRLCGPMGIEKAFIIVRDEERGCFEISSSRNINAHAAWSSLRGTDALIRWLTDNRRVVTEDEMRRNPALAALSDARDDLNTLEMEICAPVFTEEHLIAVIFLGEKRSGRPFTAEDMRMFLTLSNQMAVAITNSQLYTMVAESKVYQEKIINTLKSGIIAVDGARNISMFNPEAERIFNVQSADAVGKGIDLINDMLNGFIVDTLGNRGETRNVEITIKNNIASLPINVNTLLLKDYDDNVIGALVVLHDLTERKKLEDDQRIVDKLSTIATMAAGMVHDIRGPLTAVQTFAQLLPEKLDDHEFRTDFMATAMQEIDRVVKIVNGILRFQQHAEMVLDLKPMDLNETIRDALSMIKNTFRKNGIEETTTLPEGKLPINGDSDMMCHVFINLLSNAVEAIDGKGAIAIEAKVEPANSDGKGVVGGRHTIVITISDSGPGIKPENIGKVFDPFFSTKGKGLGLGLASIHTVIKEHKGSIRAENGPNHGAIFTIELPLVDELSAVAQSADSGAQVA